MVASPLVKICGLTSLDDAQAAIDAGADWIGLNFHPRSPRSISEDLAAEILARFGNLATFVGVFVDRPMMEVAQLARTIGLRAVQLHGSEPDSDVIALRLAGFCVIRAVRIGGVEGVDPLISSLRESHSDGSLADFLLLDAYVPSQPGGTGQSIGDEVLQRLPIHNGALVPGSDCRVPLILAGGLNPENVAARVSQVRPWMVDVASGVETSPGRKDRAAMTAFVRAAKGAPAASE